MISVLTLISFFQLCYSFNNIFSGASCTSNYNIIERKLKLEDNILSVTSKGINDDFHFHNLSVSFVDNNLSVDSKYASNSFVLPSIESTQNIFSLFKLMLYDIFSGNMSINLNNSMGSYSFGSVFGNNIFKLDFLDKISNVLDVGKHIGIHEKRLQETIINQIKSIENNQSIALFYSTPLNNLTQITKYTPDFQLSTFFKTSNKNFETFKKVSSENIINNSGNIKRGKNIQSFFNRLKDKFKPVTKKTLFSNIFKHNRNRGGKEINSQNSLTDIPSSSSLSLSLESECEQHMNNLDSVEWRKCMTLFQSVPNFTENHFNTSEIEMQVNYVPLLHKALIHCQAAYNVPLSPSSPPSDKTRTTPFVFNSEIFVNEAKQQILESFQSLNYLNNNYYNNNSYSIEFVTNAIIDAIVLPISNIYESIQNNSLTKVENNILKAKAMTSLGMSPSSSPCAFIKILQSSKACGVISYDPTHNECICSFRGTRDVIDVLTDLTFLPVTFNTRNSSLYSLSTEMNVHAGFFSSFESIIPQLDNVISSLPSNTNILFVGHSMGGALAQLAAGYYADKTPSLVSIGAPCIGNDKFCEFMNSNIHPYGGIRFWNAFDPVPYLALLVGYKHCGVSINNALREDAKELFFKCSDFVFLPNIGFDAIAPHVLYTLGSLTYVFPISYLY